MRSTEEWEVHGTKRKPRRFGAVMRRKREEAHGKR